MKFQEHGLSRRAFVSGTGTLLGTMAAATTLRAPAARLDLPPMPATVLGRTGQTVSRLAIGTGPFKRTGVTAADVRNIVLRALELGVNYVDTAPNYGTEETGYSEEKLGPVVREIRDRIFLVTKTEEPTYEGTWRLLRQSMKRLQTDRLDLVHLHNLGQESRFPDLKLVFSDQGALGALREARQQGVIRFIGASGHLYPSRFHAALDTGEIDVLMNAVNFVAQHVYDFEHKVWARARRENVGLAAMKVLGGAGPREQGFRLPAEHYQNALRYALSIPGVHCAVIGLSSVAELEQAAATVATAQPLSADESWQLARAGLDLITSQESWHEPYGPPVT